MRQRSQLHRFSVFHKSKCLFFQTNFQHSFIYQHQSLKEFFTTSPQPFLFIPRINILTNPRSRHISNTLTPLYRTQRYTYTYCTFPETTVTQLTYVQPTLAITSALSRPAIKPLHARLTMPRARVAAHKSMSRVTLRSTFTARKIITIIYTPCVKGAQRCRRINACRIQYPPLVYCYGRLVISGDGGMVNKGRGIVFFR